MGDNKQYYVYKAYVDNVLRYVGKGKGNRYKHVLGGRSTNTKLNEAYFSGKSIEVKLYKWGLSEEDALYEENRLISNNYKSLFNEMQSISSREKAVTPKSNVDRGYLLEAVILVSGVDYKYQKAIAALYLSRGDVGAARKILNKDYLVKRKYEGYSWKEAEKIYKEILLCTYNFSNGIEDKLSGYFKDIIKLTTSFNVHNYYNTLLRHKLSKEYRGKFALNVDNLREELSLGGKYSCFKDLRRRLLEPCNECLRNTIIFKGLVMETVKVGRNVKEVHYRTSKKKGS